MDDRRTGWAFVGVQVILLALVILLPGGDDWTRPGWLRAAALAMNICGFVLLVAGTLGLGRSLTPNPVPLADGRLQTGGLYAFVRHPIYTGVMAIVVGVCLGSGSIVRAILGVTTILFFNVKARWEESRLARHYPEYRAYAAVVPRFLPRLGSGLRLP